MKFIKISKKKGQEFIKLISSNFKTQEIIDRSYQIEREEEYLLFPLKLGVSDTLSKSLLNKVEFELINKEGSKSRESNKAKSIIDYLRERIPDSILALVPRSFDMIGNIAILEFDRFDDLDEEKKVIYKEEVAKALLSLNKSIKTIYEKKSEVKGIYRLRDLVYLCGIDNSETIHKENKCKFKLDIKKVYFSPRLINERKRIAESEFKNNEMIVDMFAGIGPFSIQIAKKNIVKIYAFDINPIAIQYLNENLMLNNVENRILSFNLDIREIIDNEQIGFKLESQVDRIIMNLPEKSYHFLDLACYLIKETGGMIHYYQFSEKSYSFDKIIDGISEKIAKFNYFISQVATSRIVKAYSPKVDLVALDFIIKRKL